MDTAVPGLQDFATIARILESGQLSFSVEISKLDDTGQLQRETETFYLRFPTTLEYDDANMIFEAARLKYLKSGVFNALADNEAEPEKDPFVVTMANLRAALLRDRWLTRILLRDKDGNALFPADDPDSEQKWEDFPITIKNAAREAIWKMYEIINNLPFGWEKWKKRE